MLKSSMDKSQSAAPPPDRGASGLPSWEAILASCRQHPGATEDHPWGPDGTVFKVKGRVFVFLGQRDGFATATVKVPPPMREVLLASEAAFVPSYVGRFGWVGIAISSAERWALAEELVAVSHGLVSGPHRPKSR